MRKLHSTVVLTGAILCAACSRGGDPSIVQAGDIDPAGALFTLLPVSATGVNFTNRIEETRERNVFTYRNFYNGGGVAIGDLTGDGLPEIVLTSNDEGAKIYLNAGAFRFREVTRQAGIRAQRESWTTGVTLADVNGDGRLDIYLCRAGPLAPEQRANELWINEGADAADGVPRFREAAVEYGVADQGYSTHAAFLDYDRDGDLDLFVINNSPRPASSFGVTNTRHVRDPHGGAKLFRNDDGRFADVSVSAGIHSPEMAFGLGLVVGDVNRDGWPDIYVGNDFFERDYLYVNRGDGTFGERLDEQMPVVSYFSMGLDLADVDNDLWPDIYTTDMLPEDEYRLKTTALFEGWEVYHSKVRNGYHHQLMRNMLQRNNGDGTFTDIGQMAGVARTDWSWSALVADLDLDGYKDIFVTNGLAKDITSQDYVSFLANEETMKAVTDGGRRRADFSRLTAAMDSTPIPNYAFRHVGAPGMPRFTNEAARWGLATPSFSNGAAYGDLDGDGALDLVVNNVNHEAFVYRNNARVLAPDRANFLRIALEGQAKNRFAIGARVTVYAAAERFMQEQAPARGFQSSVDYTLVFGLGARAAVDSVVVEWPDGRASVVSQPTVNDLLVVSHTSAATRRDTAPKNGTRAGTALTAVSDRAGISFVHRENEFVDFDRERLLPRMLSMEGPAVAAGDVDGDGLDDVFIGGAKHQVGQVYLQKRDGAFIRLAQPAFDADAISEDVGAVFFDADADGDRDLYVVSGGNEYSDAAPALQDRLYLNDGRGTFRKSESGLPSQQLSGSRVVSADYDGDGDIDLFVGGRSVPWRYGVNARSMLLRNDGRGHFTDAAGDLAPELVWAGMVTDAAWADVDGDRRLDLVVVGEWMPITIYRNAGNGRLERLAARGLEQSAGWWNRVVARDVTGDGRVDFVVGNLGLNTRFSASPERPLRLHVKDFDGNGFSEQIVSYYNDSVSYPLVLRDDLLATLPRLRPRLGSYADYARKTLADVFPPEELRDATVKEAQTLATSLVRNNGDGSFSLVPLPAEAQVAPVYGILADDVTGDGQVDLLLGGNFDGFKPEVGRASSGRGVLLAGVGGGTWRAASPVESGFVVPGQGRDIVRLTTARGAAYLVARNNDSLLLFVRQAERSPRVVARAAQ